MKIKKIAFDLYIFICVCFLIMYTLKDELCQYQFSIKKRPSGIFFKKDVKKGIEMIHGRPLQLLLNFIKIKIVSVIPVVNAKAMRTQKRGDGFIILE